MKRATIGALVLTLAVASAAPAAPTDEEKCRAAKQNALRKRSFCVDGERRKEILGKTPDTAKCEAKFDQAIAAADEAAAKQDASCRWLDNADGTATDLNSGLQWELKTDDGGVHDQDNAYVWGDATGAAFLSAFNAGVSGDASTTTGCFAGHCDWRVPTIGELRSMLDSESAQCVYPCTSIPGFTRTGTYDFYWSSSTNSGASDEAWSVYFDYGQVSSLSKGIPFCFVRAVRGGSGA
jgi:hypothetical protein